MSLAFLWAGHLLIARPNPLSILPHLALCSVRMLYKGHISELFCLLDFSCFTPEEHQWEMGLGKSKYSFGSLPVGSLQAGCLQDKCHSSC